RPEAPVGSGASTWPETPPIAPSVSGDLSSALAHVIDDDADVTGVGTTYVPTGRTKRPPQVDESSRPFYARLNFRRTLIPILLTLGVALPVLGGWWFALDQDSPLRGVGLGLPTTLIAVGVILLTLG